MEGIKIRALVTGGTDYKESDKLITLCSVERGKIVAQLKGCRKQNSKLRFCGAPFCFGEYILSEKNGYYVITGATAIDQFVSLSSDLDRYYAGCVILETLNKASREGENITSLILTALDHIKMLSYDSFDEGLILISFFLTVFKLSGYELSFDACRVCRSTSFQKKFFSNEQGGIVCNICSQREAVPVSVSAVNLMKSISNGISLSVLCFEKSVIRESLVLLGQYFVFFTKEKIHSLIEYLNISKTN